MGISFLPRTANAQKAWIQLLDHTKRVYKKRSSVTSSEVSRLMSELHQVLDVHNFVNSTTEEKELCKRVNKLLSIITPIHTKLCQIQDPDWGDLEKFLKKSK